MVWHTTDYVGDEQTKCRASWQDLDICLKIMEMPFGLCNEEELEIVSDLRKHFRGAMSLASVHLKTWATEYHD